MKVACTTCTLSTPLYRKRHIIMEHTQIPFTRKNLRRTGCRAVLLLGALVASGLTAAADEYPNKPITLVVPYAPGGGVDAVGRILGQELSKQLEQTVLVD